ncbi:hypothetical protein [Ochrobactrum sp. A-1]|uniref:hypothetical protein n=1 Tax=Ochrobactrum sp. A-1 TaxID=2920940 RepID=UPI001F0B621D|nr:hypothetical protein [Ochrobactrum sp. A-1]
MASELKWFRRLERVLRDMPDNVEVTVHQHGVVELHERGETQKFFAEHGHADSVPFLSFFEANNIVGRESSV